MIVGSVSDLAVWINKLDSNLSKIEDRALTRSAMIVATQAKKNVKESVLENAGKRSGVFAKIFKSKGKLRQSIAYKVTRNEASIGSPLVYAPFQEYGTGIYAKNGDGRKSPWFFPVKGVSLSKSELKEGRGRFFYAKDGTTLLVKTRGAKPNPFLQPALEGKMKDIKAVFMEYIQRSFDK